MMTKRSLWFCLFLVLLAVPLLAAEETRLLRFPAIHGDTIVFTYAGDLYAVAATGGVARKLTTHDGFEMFARFSPDGKWLAFTGQYDGNTEVYLMPADGGVPKRLTYTATLGRDDVSDRMGPNNIVMGWTPDGKGIVFRSRMHEFDDFKGQLFLASPDGGIPAQLPLPRGGFCSYSPDGKMLAYNRIFREFRTWKRYRGGMADDIWIYDFATKKTENITNNPAGDIIPMWAGNKIYFLSDRDDSKRFNLFAYDRTTRKTSQLTQFKDYDIKFPSLGDKAIVFENGGRIYRFDLATEKAVPVPVVIQDDLAGGRGGVIEVGQRVHSFEIAPDGKRALFGSRGDLFTVPAESGITRDLTGTPGVHERNAKWSPDGKWIAYISDASGEDEIWILPQDGRGTAQQLTTGGDCYKYALFWSPDSKKILWSDNKLRLRYLTVETKAVTEVTQAKSGEIRDYAWAPDSQWIAYTQPEYGRMSRVFLYGLEKAVSVPVTDEWYASGSPAFSSDGKYLFFVSNRDFRPFYGWTEWNFIMRDMARIYFVTLAADTENPLTPQNDEVAVAKDEPKKDGDEAKTAEAGKKEEPAKKEEGKEKKAVTVKVDAEGLTDRIVGLPLTPSAYRDLVSVGSKLYYLRRGSTDTATQFFLYDLTKRKETPLGEIDGFEVSADQKKMLVAKSGAFAIIDLPMGKVELKDRLDLSDMEVKLDRHAEWNQIFNECWRQMRDFFYAPNMNGVDWASMKAKYGALLPYVNTRADLTYLIGEMIGELSSGHCYVGGGDQPRVKKIPMGLLGAQLEKDPASGYFRITRILAGENWDKERRSPLTELGVGAKVGEFITAVNGKTTKDMTDIYAALVGTAGKQVQITLNAAASETGGREVIVVPTDNEIPLYYYNWVEDNIRKVEQATHGEVGYIHVPDMGPEGLVEFVKHFTPQLRKKALIVDVRGNGGGNVSPMLIERLRRELVMVDMSRNVPVPEPSPGDMIVGPMVCLCDEFSASDGDLFPYRFQKDGLGPLIGKRTWGGVVGIRGSLPLLDGGTLNRPEFAPYDKDGKGWIIEGHGVDPDIVVDNDPAQEYAGNDQQLNKAIEVILDLLKTKGKTLPPIPPYPDRSK
jgi:tricorn protease